MFKQQLSFSPSLVLLIGNALISAAMVGCGGSPESGTSAANTTTSPATTTSSAGEAVASTPGTANQNDSATEQVGQKQQKPAATITASINNPVADTIETSETTTSIEPQPEAAVDEATAILQKIVALRVSPYPTDLQEAKKARRERNEQIVDMATNVLRLTMDDEQRQPQFRQAIGQMLEARFQMALVGTSEDIERLYADIQTLNDHDPESVAAAEGVYYAAKFAHTKAGLLGKSQPEWFETLSRWAREFSDRFPNQQQRAVTLLFGAARSCELHALTATDDDLAQRLTTESRLCYTALAEKFPQTPQGQESTAVLRRMAIVGQPLAQFSGPTIDGGFVSADEFAGKPTVIYFWSTEDAEFVEGMLPLIQKIRSQAGPDRLRMVGVPLDENEPALLAFMEQNPVPGPQIFFPNPAQRSWNSPLVRFWGLSKSPSIWLIDAKGSVVSTTLSADELVPALQKAFRQ